MKMVINLIKDGTQNLPLIPSVPIQLTAEASDGDVRIHVSIYGLWIKLLDVTIISSPMYEAS